MTTIVVVLWSMADSYSKWISHKICLNSIFCLDLLEKMPKLVVADNGRTIHQLLSKLFR